MKAGDGRCGVVWCGVAWRGVVWHGVVWYQRAAGVSVRWCDEGRNKYQHKAPWAPRGGVEGGGRTLADAGEATNSPPRLH